MDFSASGCQAVARKARKHVTPSISFVTEKECSVSVLESAQTRMVFGQASMSSP